MLDGQCLFDCPLGYYMQSTDRLCLSCNLTICRACVDTPNNCSLCAAGYYMDTAIGVCVQECPGGTFANSFTLECTGCTYPCSACLSENNCTAC